MEEQRNRDERRRLFTGDGHWRAAGRQPRHSGHLDRADRGRQILDKGLRGSESTGLSGHPHRRDGRAHVATRLDARHSFFAFPPEIRRVLDTTSALESVHTRLRKILATGGHFPTDEAATK